MPQPDAPSSVGADHLTTIEVARMLGMAVRSVQLMVDRGELEAWRTPGGHRRISRESVARWTEGRGLSTRPSDLGPPVTQGTAPRAAAARPRVLLIEDSVHFQNLIKLLMAQRFPSVDLEVASDGIAGLAMFGRSEPDVLIVDILLPGLDGATLITTLRTHPQFRRTRLLVVTSLDEDQRAPYALALQGVPVVHKPRLALDLPPLLAQCLEDAAQGRGAAATTPAADVHPSR